MPLGGRGLDLDLELELGEEEDNAGGGLMHCLMVLGCHWPLAAFAACVRAFVDEWGRGSRKPIRNIFYFLF
jgi:hypothetical protein